MSIRNFKTIPTIFVATLLTGGLFGLALASLTVDTSFAESGGGSIAAGKGPKKPPKAKQFSEIPSLAPGHAIALPNINFIAIDDVCKSHIQAQNVGAEVSVAVLMTWAELNDPCASAPGPLGVECSGLLKPGSAWTFSNSGIPAGSKSGFVYSFSTEICMGQEISSLMCANLQAMVGDDGAFRTFHEDYLGSGQVFGIPVAQVRGAPLAGVVHRACPGDTTPGVEVTTAYEGVSEIMYDAPLQGKKTYRYQVPLVIADEAGFISSLSIQNAGHECATVDIVFREQGSCLDTAWCSPNLLQVVPGQSLSIEPIDCLGEGWQGSVEVNSDRPLAITQDIVGRDTISTYRGAAAGFKAGATELFGPLYYSELHGWDTHIQIQNLGKKTAQAKVVFYEGGVVKATYIQTICANGSETVLHSVVENQPGSESGWIQIESLPLNGKKSQPLEAVAWLIKYSDAARTQATEALAYNLLHKSEVGSSAALPLVYKDRFSTGLLTDIQLAASTAFDGGSSGTEDLDHDAYDSSGLVPGHSYSVLLEQALTVYEDLYEILLPVPWNVIAEGYKGSMLIEDDQDLARFGAVGIVRNRSSLGGDSPGDEAAGYIAMPVE